MKLFNKLFKNKNYNNDNNNNKYDIYDLSHLPKIDISVLKTENIIADNITADLSHLPKIDIGVLKTENIIVNNITVKDTLINLELNREDTI